MAFRNELCQMTVYVAHAGTGSGASAQDPLPIAAQDLDVLPEGFVAYDATFVLTTAVTGTTAINIGDDDDDDGYVDALDITYATPAAYPGSGVYVASDAEKHYVDETKTLKMAITGASTAGAGVVHVKGYRV